MIVKLRVGITGSVDTIAYPPPGIAFEVPDHIGASLCGKGLAIPVEAGPVLERAVEPQAYIETREESGLMKASIEAPVKRGPGRPRKHPRD